MAYTFKHFWSHPCCTAFVVGHMGLYITGSTKITDLQHSSTHDQQQTGNICNYAMDLVYLVKDLYNKPEMTHQLCI